jgi:hypothetical protein
MIVRLQVKQSKRTQVRDLLGAHHLRRPNKINARSSIDHVDGSGTGV